jgi:hypothetical protein
MLAHPHLLLWLIPCLSRPTLHHIVGARKLPTIELFHESPTSRKIHALAT